MGLGKIIHIALKFNFQITGRKLAKCNECGIEYETGVKDFCSEECFKKNIQKRINEATKNDMSHTSKIIKNSS